MKIRINGNVYTFNQNDIDKKRSILYQWYVKKQQGEKVTIECLCIENRKKHPLLYINTPNYKSSNYYLANKPSSTILHHWDCPNKKHENIGEEGFHIDQEGNLICHLTFDTPKHKGNSKEPSNRNSTITSKKSSIPDTPKIRLSTLFCALLQLVDINIYKDGQARNLVNRLEVAASKTTVRNIQLKGKGFSRIYVAALKLDKNKKAFKSQINSESKHPYSPYLIIGWGDITAEPVQEKNFFIPIPLYSVDDHSVLITNVYLYRPMYQTIITDYENGRNKVTTGYWVLWRKPEGQYVNIKAAAFIPAEKFTGIPVDSVYEATMIQELVKHHRFFKKPLLGYEVKTNTIKGRPDFVLLDTNPYTMVEVAGDRSIPYQKHLKLKKEAYIKAGYRYTEWRAYDTNHKLESLRLDLK